MEDYGDWIWDEAEYNFFMSLSDIAKLEYMYDYFNLDDDSIEGEFELEDVEDDSPITSVDVVITDSHLIITCDNDEVADKTVGMFKMDGFIILLQHQRGKSRYYEYVGKSDPFSMN